MTIRNGEPGIMGELLSDIEHEYELISHKQLSNVNLFLVNLTYRTPHLHNDIEILQVIEGGLHIKTFDEEYDIGPGEIALFNPNEFHTLQSIESCCILLTIQVDTSFCAKHYPAIKSTHFDTNNITKVIPFNRTLDLIGICYNLGYNYFSSIPGFELRCISDLYRIFWYLVTFVPNHSLKDSEHLTQKTNELRLTRIITYIHQHYMEKVTLSEIAEKENLSMTYLSHLFKKFMKMSFQEYVNALRFEHAVLLLKKTDMRIIDICLESGFSDTKYLNKRFLQTYQLTAKEFREKMTFEAEPPMEMKDENMEQYIYTPEQALEIMRKHYHFDCDFNKY
ncbi:MAG: AraC family transcriptional regulator [Lachnospiraceae bacterium]|nr:AraC family transcriptional regulator [uncultured Faecalicatena sp.]MDY5618048.1 AraC family transcriptional regulator [Lachnospiraceae bacterium]